MDQVYIVIITDSNTDSQEVARVYTDHTKAMDFIAECKYVEDRPNFGYRIQKLPVDIDPAQPY